MEDDLPTDVSETTESAAPLPAVAVAAGTSSASEGQDQPAATAAAAAAAGVNAKACSPQEGGPSSLEADVVESSEVFAELSSPEEA